MGESTFGNRSTPEIARMIQRTILERKQQQNYLVFQRLHVPEEVLQLISQGFGVVLEH